MTQGPNMKRLAVRKMTNMAIPKDGTARDALEFLRDPQRLHDTAKKATEWALLAVAAVREANDPNPWRNADDEEIAGEILRRIKEREAKE